MRTSKKSEKVLKKGRYIPNSDIEIGTCHISYLCAQNKGCGRSQNTWGIPHIRHVIGCHHGTARKTVGTNGEDQTKHLTKYHNGETKCRMCFVYVVL